MAADEHQATALGLGDRSRERKADAVIAAVAASKEVVLARGCVERALVGNVDGGATRDLSNRQPNCARSMIERIVDENIKNLVDCGARRTNSDIAFDP